MNKISNKEFEKLFDAEEDISEFVDPTTRRTVAPIEFNETIKHVDVELQDNVFSRLNKEAGKRGMPINQWISEKLKEAL